MDEYISWFSMLTFILFIKHWDHVYFVLYLDLDILQILIHLICIATLWSRYNCYPPLQTKRRVQTTCQLTQPVGKESEDLTIPCFGSISHSQPPCCFLEGFTTKHITRSLTIVVAMVHNILWIQRESLFSFGSVVCDISITMFMQVFINTFM